VLADLILGFDRAMNCRGVEDAEEREESLGKVYLVGAGPGDPD